MASELDITSYILFEKKKIFLKCSLYFLSMTADVKVTGLLSIYIFKKRLRHCGLNAHNTVSKTIDLLMCGPYLFLSHVLY